MYTSIELRHWETILKTAYIHSESLKIVSFALREEKTWIWFVDINIFAIKFNFLIDLIGMFFWKIKLFPATDLRFWIEVKIYLYLLKEKVNAYANCMI